MDKKSLPGIDDVWRPSLGNAVSLIIAGKTG
jgi:hypothetical protein